MARRAGEEVTEAPRPVDVHALVERALRLDGTITEEEMERCRQLAEVFDGLHDSSIVPDPIITASLNRDALREMLDVQSSGNSRGLAEELSGILGNLGEGFPVSETEEETLRDAFRHYQETLDGATPTAA